MRKGIITFAVLLLMLAAGLWLWPTSIDSWVYRQQFEQSERLIAAIETFELEQGVLPTEDEITRLKIDLGLPGDEQCPCYQIEKGGRFIVWFGYQTTGSSMVYDSRTAAWSPRH